MKQSSGCTVDPFYNSQGSSCIKGSESSTESSPGMCCESSELSPLKN